MTHPFAGGPVQDIETAILWAAAIGLAPTPGLLAGAEPDRLARLATEHRLWGALGRLLAQSPVPPTLQDLAERSGRQRRSLIARNLLLLAAARNAGSILAGAGIQAVALKGLDLAFRSYPDPGCRAFDDLDLLVRPRDAAAADRILLQSGCHRIDDDQGPITQSLGGEAAYRPPGEAAVGGARIEIHWQLHQYARYLPVIHAPVEAIVERSVAWDEGAPLRVMDPTDRVLYLCLHHGLVHGWKTLAWVADLHLGLRQVALHRWGTRGWVDDQWLRDLGRQARAWGTAGALATGRAIAAGLQGKRGPKPPWSGPGLAARLVLAGRASRLRPLVGWLQLDSPGAAATAAMRALFPPAAWRRRRTGGSWFRVPGLLWAALRNTPENPA